MMVPGQNTQIYGEKFTSCTFWKSHGSSDSSSCIYLDATTVGSGNGSINDIEFLNCTVYSDQNTPTSNVYGYRFSGSDIRIDGGQVGNMGASGGAGVAITGPVGNVTITNVRFSPNYVNAGELRLG